MKHAGPPVEGLAGLLLESPIFGKLWSPIIRVPPFRRDLPAFGRQHRAEQSVRDPDAPRIRTRHAQVRPHRHRHAIRLRLPDALQSGGRLSACHDEEASPSLDHSRTALVPSGQLQHQVLARQRRDDLGRVGRRERRPRPRLRRPVAQLARTRRQPRRPDREPECSSSGPIPTAAA